MTSNQPSAEASLFGASTLTDEELVAGIETATLSADRFRHGDHVRLAWIYLTRTPAVDAPPADGRMARAIKRFAEVHGAAAKYHETMTRLWMHLVSAHVRATPNASSFAEFVAANDELLDRALPFRFYSRQRLLGAEARANWVDPDRAALPRA